MSAISRLIPKQRSRCNLSLYLVANRPSFQDERLFFSKIQAAVGGGVSCVQLRDHRSDYSTCLKTASRLKRLFPRVPLFINTLESMKLAESIGAEGVYLEEGTSLSEARAILGEKAIIGVPVKRMNDIFAAEADYLSVKVFASKQTCPKNDLLWGIEGLREIRRLSSRRIVAIGGLNLDCVESIYSVLCPDDGVAMAGGLMGEEDPYLAAKKLQAIREKVRRQL